MAALLAAAGIGLMAMTAIAASAEPQEAQPDKGAEAFMVVLEVSPGRSDCRHAPHQSQWEEVLDKMTKLGAQITDDNYER